MRVGSRERFRSQEESDVSSDADGNSAADFDPGSGSDTVARKVKEKETSTLRKKKPVKSPRGKISRASSGRVRANVSYVYDDNDEDDQASEDEEEDSADDLQPKKSSKKSPQRSAKKKPRDSSQTSLSVRDMVLKTIRALNDHPKKGSSLRAIKKAISENWTVNMKVYEPKLKKFLANAVATGEVVQPRGKGLSGTYSLPTMKAPKKRKKRFVVETKFDTEEIEYVPAKTARDEERERHEAELEQQRQERKLQKEQMMLEKSNKPKKKLQRKVDWEVEAIKGMKEVHGDTFYLVKFKGWPKPQWEPEENVEGCNDFIEEYLEEKEQKELEMEARRKLEEEKGIYEVKRILEVKFRKDKTREFLVRWMNHGPEDDTWEPEENLSCPDLIEKFMKKVEEHSIVEQKRLRAAPKKVERLAFALPGTRSSKRGLRGLRITYEDMDE